MHLRAGPWGLIMDLSIGRQAMVSAKAAGASTLSERKAEKTKEVLAAKEKDRGKEKETVLLRQKERCWCPRPRGSR